MVRSIGKQSGESVESVLKKKRKAAVGRICRKGRYTGGGLFDDRLAIHTSVVPAGGRARIVYDALINQGRDVQNILRFIVRLSKVYRDIDLR